MAACGYTPAEIDELTLHDVIGLFSDWRDCPPVHEILKSVYRIEPKARSALAGSGGDPSGIGNLIARFPDGFVKAREGG